MTILPESEDHFHQLSQTGAYEWSYFDGLSDDGEWGFVAIWFRGVPMSPWYSAAADRALRRGEALDPLRHCAFNFSLYHRGRRIYFALHERGSETFRTDYRTADVSFGGNTLYANAIPAGGTFYALSVDTEFPRQASRVVGEIAIRSERQDLSPLLQHQPAPGIASEGHFWIPAALAGSFTANLGFWRIARGTRRISFSGRAYHDRNFGTAPLHHLPGNWLWGRVHSGNRTFVYFDVARGFPKHRFQRALMLEQGKITAASSNLETAQIAPTKKAWGIDHAGVLEGGGDGLEFAIAPRWRVDAGPFYHRSIQSISVRQPGAQPLQGLGIGEVLRPSRLGIGWIRPFIKFRAKKSQ